MTFRCVVVLSLAGATSSIAVIDTSGAVPNGMPNGCAGAVNNTFSEPCNISNGVGFHSQHPALFCDSVCPWILAQDTNGRV